MMGSKIYFCRRRLIKRNKNLLVMTLAGEVGGYTHVVDNWLKESEYGTYTIIFTDSCLKQVPKYLLKTVEKTGTRLLFLKNRNDMDNRQVWKKNC